MKVHPAYLAGFFDGEGHLSIRRRVRKTRPNPFYDISIELGQKIIGPLEALQSTYGGRIKLRSPHTKNRLFVLIWERKADVLCILRTMEPYVIGKRESLLEAIHLLTK